MRPLVATSLFLFLGIGVTTSIRCRDLTLFAFIFIFVSRPRFDVVALFLLSYSLLLGHSFSFMLRHPSIVLNFQAGRDSKLFVCLFSCRDVEIRSRPSIFFNHCISCHDLKSMSRPSLLPIQSQPHFSVSTVSFNFSISGRDPTVLPCFGIYVTTSI